MTTATVCVKCHMSKPSGAFAFRSRARGTLRRECKACRSEYAADYYAKNRESVKAKSAKRWEEKRPEILAKMASYYVANADRIKGRVAAYVAANPEKRKAASARWYERNREQVILASAAWSKLHPETRRVVAGRRRARVAGAGGSGLSPKQWRQILEEAGGRCAYCGNEATLTMDHVEPIARGGQHDANNVVAACPRCNTSKCASPLVVWLARRPDALRAA